MKIEQLTFTRYLAALTVVFFHYGTQVFPVNIPWLSPLLTAGPVAVSYFYALSGFIMAIAYHHPDRQLFNRQRYWIARLARIYPVYLLALLLMIAARFATTGRDPVTVLLSLSLLQAWLPDYPLTLNSPGWSLSVEAFFYLLFPVLVMLARRHTLTTLTLATVLLWLVTQAVHTYWLNDASYVPFSTLHDVIYYNPLLHLNTFLLGFVAGVALKKGRLQTRVPDAKRLMLLGMTLATLAVLMLIRQPLIVQTGWRFDYTNGLLAPLFVLVIVLLAMDGSRLSAVLRHPWLVLLGEASYSLYILQKPLHGIYEKIMPAAIAPDSALHFYLFLLVLTGTALFSYRFFETPLRHFINNFVNRSP